MSKPTQYVLCWTDPAGISHRFPYSQRAQARGAAIIKRAQGMSNVYVKPEGY